MPQDLLPRAFQADLDRLYSRVIRPTLAELSLYPNIKHGEFTSQDEFLDNCQKQTSNLLAYEARRSFALTLSALFERQLRVWARVLFPKEERIRDGSMKFEKLLTKAGNHREIDLAAASAGETIRELYFLANVVRHGDGRSCNALWAHTRRYWEHMNEAAAEDCKQRAILSEFVQITDEDFVRYIRAATRFWGLADREFGAIVDGPY